MINALNKPSDEKNYADAAAQFAYRAYGFSGDQYNYIVSSIDKQFMEMAVKLQDVDSHCRSIELRIEDLKTDIHDIRDSQRELADKVTTLENRPAIETKARWDSLSDKLIWLFAAGIAGFLLANVLPGVF